MPKSRTSYPLEYRHVLVELVRAGRSPDEFEPSAQTIENWVAQADRDAGARSDGLSNVERKELAKLRLDVKQLRLAIESAIGEGTRVYSAPATYDTVTRVLR